MRNSFLIFSSYGFLTGLFLLLINDFFLKEYFHNFLTGKLSDFVGVAIFSMFWAAFFPKNRKVVYLVCALFFIYWKSEYSQSLINTWNHLTPFNYVRVVDYWDLLSLLILPLAFSYQSNLEEVKKIKLNPILPLVVASFSFLATSDDGSPRLYFEIQEVYDFNLSKDALFGEILNIDSIDVRNPNKSVPEIDTLDITYSSSLCNGNEFMQAWVELRAQTDSTSTLSTICFTTSCSEDINETQVVSDFESRIIDEILD